MMAFGGEVYSRWLDHEGRTYMNGISVRINKAPESFPVLSIMSGHNNKIAAYKSRKRPKPDTKNAGTLILYIPAYKIVRNKVLLLIINLVFGIFLKQPKQTKTL